MRQAMFEVWGKSVEETVIDAYILIQTDIRKQAFVAAEVGAIPGIATADAVVGPYDVIALAAADDVPSLGRLVITKIQAVEGVSRTITIQVVEF